MDESPHPASLEPFVGPTTTTTNPVCLSAVSAACAAVDALEDSLLAVLRRAVDADDAAAAAKEAAAAESGPESKPADNGAGSGNDAVAEIESSSISERLAELKTAVETALDVNHADRAEMEASEEPPDLETLAAVRAEQDRFTTDVREGNVRLKAVIDHLRHVQRDVAIVQSASCRVRGLEGFGEGIAADEEE